MHAIGKLSGTRVKQCAVVRAASGSPFRAPCACAEVRKGLPDAARLGWIGVRLVSKAQLAKRLSALLRPLEVEWLPERERASATFPCVALAPASMQS